MSFADQRAVSYTQFIAGEFRAGRGTGAVDVLNPATGESLGELSYASDEDLDEAIDAAVVAFPKWRRTSPVERAALLRGIGTRLRERSTEIARQITLELGKPVAEAVREVELAAELFEWSAEEGRRAYGRVIPARSPGIRQTAIPEPVGPVAAFGGWNAPLVTPSRKISSALAAGCTIVVKPSEETPGVALAIARAAADAGVPAGVVNLVFGDPAQVSDRLLEAPGIRMVSFTGATAIGKQIGAKAALTMKRATLELGGHAPVIVMDDVNVAQVARSAVFAKFRNAGQVCTSPTRFYVHERIYEQFVATFVETARTVKVGNGLDAGVQMGPLKNGRRRDAIESLIEDARAHGVNVACGGSRIDGPGFFHEPTVLTHFVDSCRAANEEPFGPLALLRPIRDVDHAIAEANRLPFGLASYLFTRDIAVAQKLTEEIDSGAVCLNEWVVSLAETPFGGVKDSGLGREGGCEGLEEYLRIKSIRQGLVL